MDQSEEDLSRYYNEEYQKTNSLVVGKLQTPREHFDDSIKALNGLLNNVRPLLRPRMTVLEVGCGTGEILYSIKPSVREVVAIELNKEFVDFIRNDLKIEAYNQDVNTMDFGTRKFDLILCIGTLEHLSNPLATLRTMKNLLAEGGILYLEVPNTEEAMNLYLPEPSRKKFNTFFWHRAHTFYFTRDTLKKILDRAGFSSNITSRHQYTLINFLNWYFTGQRQNRYLEASTGVRLFTGSNPFETEMNRMMEEMETRFHIILSKTGHGDTLCAVARKRMEEV
jgi:2-polyprenyl-3-methyl-5-hydroxy-6-metoxy-1,4-benzoquinol methylase